MIKDKKNKTMQIRLNQEDFELFQIASYSIGQTPSQLVRMFVDTTINTLKVKAQKGELNIEDYKAVFHDKL